MLEILVGDGIAEEPVIPARALRRQISVDACVITDGLSVDIFKRHLNIGKMGRQTCEVGRLATSYYARDC